MQQVSVVIITKNEECNIIDCILSAKKISNDIIVIDSGSTDATLALARMENVKIYSILWEGYGHARNTGAMLADNDWIFSLDADERITEALAHSLKQIQFTNERSIYAFKRINYFSSRKIRYGSFAHDRVSRLYNRRNAQWNMFPVHEKLTGKNIKRIMVKTNLVHFTATGEQDYLPKIMGYASLCALKYKQEGKKFIYARSLFSPAFNFIKDYIFQLGFLDRYPGFIIAKLNAAYTRKKYQQLRLLLNPEKGQSEPPAASAEFTPEDRLLSFLMK
ncbi:MAG: glycosyltransferase family 2 protein [Bacteroidota bacterium]